MRREIRPRHARGVMFRLRINGLEPGTPHRIRRVPGHEGIDGVERFAGFRPAGGKFGRTGIERIWHGYSELPRQAGQGLWLGLVGATIVVRYQTVWPFS